MSSTSVAMTPSFGDRIQGITEQLASTHDRSVILDLVLQAAHDSFDALGGAVLMVTDTRDRVELALTRGHEAGAAILWQDGPLEDASPVSDALTRRQPLLFEHEGALTSAYPDLETRTRAVAPVATAVLPIVLEERSLGVIVLDFREPHHFTDSEQRFFRTLTALAAVSLGWAELAQNLDVQVRNRTLALDAFAQFTERAASTSDVLDLARMGVEMLQNILPDVSAVYYEPTGRAWRARVWTDDIAPDIVDVLKQGVPFTAPSFQEACDRREAVFVPRWDAEREGVALTEQYGAGALYVCFTGDVPRGLLAMGMQQRDAWSDRERAVFQAVGRSLSLVLERAATATTLKRQNHALRETNEELEALTYSVSHDLMSPVRHVTSFAALARRSANDSSRVQRYLDIVDQSAQRMNTLLDAMLQLSRVGRRDLRLGLVDVNLIVRTVQLDLGPDLVDRAVTWRIQPLPVVWADQDALHEIVRQLLSNALKFSRDEPQVILEIWAEDDPEQWTLCVRDNGAGFDMRYAHKLFGIFQRLHSQEEFGGSGVGLAIVQRLVRRHHGTVTAASTPGEGATFHVTLPKPEQPAM